MHASDDHLGGSGWYYDMKHDPSMTLKMELALTSLTALSSLMSVIGASFILISVLFPDKKSLSRYIICCMSVSDLMVALPALLSCCYKLGKYPDDFTLDDMPTTACKVQAYFIAVGYFLSYIWTTGLAQHVFLLLRYGINAAIKAFLVLVVVSVMPFVLNIYTYQAGILGGPGVTGIYVPPTPGPPANLTPATVARPDLNWCWINQTSDVNCYWMIADGKGFEILAYVIISVYTILGYRELAQHYDDFSGSPRAKKLILIPVIFVFSRIWGTIIVLTSVWRDCSKPPTKDVAMVITRFLEHIFDNAQGWINWILFWWTIGGHKSFVLLLRGVCCKDTIGDEDALIVSNDGVACAGFSTVSATARKSSSTVQ